MTVFFALTTSVLYGLSDFGGGLLTRRIPAATVVVVSQSVAAVTLGVVVVVTGAWSEAGPRLWLAFAAGLVGPAALLCFYRALALGPMGIVSPLATVGVAVPVGVGVFLGERPGPMEAVGVVVVVCGLVLAGGPELRGTPAQRSTIALTLVAAFGFGAVFALISESFTTVTGLFLALFVQRATNVVAGGAALYVSVRRGTAPLPAAGFPWRSLPALAFVGLSDVAANGTYSIGARLGPVTVAAVLASLYPVVTALAARGLLKERLRAVQAAGAGLALMGTVLLATG